MSKQLHTLRMLARRFKRYGISMAWLQTEAEAGRIPCFRAGRRVLFDPEAVECALLERASQPQQETPENVQGNEAPARQKGGLVPPPSKYEPTQDYPPS